MEVFTPEEKENFGKTVNEYLKEHGIDAPPIKIKIFFSGHRYSQDIDGLHEFIENSDIYIPECNGWGPKTLELYRDISSGRKSVQAALNFLVSSSQPREFDKRFLESFAKTNKKIGFVDIERAELPSKGAPYKGHEYFVQQFESTISKARTWPGYKLPDFGIVLREFGQASRQFALATKIRNVNMLSRLGPTIKGILQDDPALLSQDKLEVAMFLGAVHTPVFHELKKREESVERYMNYEDGNMTYADSEIHRRYELDKDVDNDMLATTFLVGLYKRNFPRLETYFKSTQQLLRFYMDVKKAFSLDEIEKIYYRLKSSDFEQFFDREIKKKKLFPIQWVKRNRRQGRNQPNRAPLPSKAKS